MEVSRHSECGFKCHTRKSSGISDARGAFYKIFPFPLISTDVKHQILFIDVTIIVVKIDMHCLDLKQMLMRLSEAVGD